MKILANKDIRDFFLALTFVLCVLLLITEGFMWLSYRSFAPWLPLLFLLAGARCGCSALDILSVRTAQWSRRYRR